MQVFGGRGRMRLRRAKGPTKDQIKQYAREAQAKAEMLEAQAKSERMMRREAQAKLEAEQAKTLGQRLKAKVRTLFQRRSLGRA